MSYFFKIAQQEHFFGTFEKWAPGVSCDLMWHVGINTPVVKFILNMFVPSDGSKSCESRKRGQHFHGVCYPGQPNEQRLCFGHQSSHIPAWKATRNQILHGTVPLSFLHYPQGYQRVTTHAE